jgi:1,4-alpha-glucan branching enzyme
MIKRAPGSSGSVKVTFAVSVDECDQPVSVVGDFNGWDPLATPLRKRSNGTRSATLVVPTGRSYRFKYLADGGTWFCDSEADAYADNDFAATDSLLVV